MMCISLLLSSEVPEFLVQLSAPDELEINNHGRQCIIV